MDEILNRKSALGSYIFCLAGLLSENYQVYINNVPYIQLNQKTTTDVSIVPKKRKWASLIPRFLKSTIKLYSQLKTNEANLKSLLSSADSSYDFIMEYYTLGSVAGIKMANQCKSRLVLVYDAPVFEEHVFFNGPVLALKSRVKKNEMESCKAAYKIICYSDAVKQHIEKINSVAENNIFTHQNVDYSRFEFYEPIRKNPALKICFIGSFLKWHKVEFLIRAFANLSNDFPGTTLYLIGEGQMLENCKKMANEAGLGNNVVFTGYLDGENLEELKKEMHIGVMPGSNWYGAPNKIFEYGAAGMAVIAPATPTITAIFGRQNGIAYFENENYKDFESKFKQLVATVAQKDLSNASALHRFIKENYNSHKTVEFYTQIFA